MPTTGLFAGSLFAGTPVTADDGTTAYKLQVDTSGGGGTGAGANQVQGNSAAGATDVGNPVKAGGVYVGASPPTLTTGQRGDLQLNARGSLRVELANGGGVINTQTSGSVVGLVTTGIAANSLATAQATVGTSATQIVAARGSRVAVTIVNSGTTDVFVGAAGVTATTGILLPGTKGASITIPTNAAIFGVVGTGTQVVSALETF